MIGMTPGRVFAVILHVLIILIIILFVVISIRKAKDG